MVTIRQSDSAAIASEAATASLNRGDAAVTAEQLKPAAPEDRVMGPNPYNLEVVECPPLTGESPTLCVFVTIHAGKIGAGVYRKTAKSGRNGRYARYPSNSSPLFGRKLRLRRETRQQTWLFGFDIRLARARLGGSECQIRSTGLPIHRHKARHLFDTPQPGPNGRER
jgi:hypothetical protein